MVDSRLKAERAGVREDENESVERRVERKRTEQNNEARKVGPSPSTFTKEKRKPLALLSLYPPSNNRKENKERSAKNALCGNAC